MFPVRCIVMGSMLDLMILCMHSGGTGISGYLASMHLVVLKVRTARRGGAPSGRSSTTTVGDHFQIVCPKQRMCLMRVPEISGHHPGLCN